MPLTNAESHYFGSLLQADIDLYSKRAIDASAASDAAEVKGSPYQVAQESTATFNRGVVAGLRYAKDLLEKAQT